MNDMERRKFEDTFKDAFNGAEVEPSDNVWTNLELDLEKDDSTKMKRRLLFYQLVAAASISFALMMAGVGYYVLSSRADELAALATTPNTTTNTSSSNTTILSPAIETANSNTTGTNIAQGNNESGSAFLNQTPANERMDHNDTANNGVVSAAHNSGTTAASSLDNMLAARTEHSSSVNASVADNTASSQTNTASGVSAPRKPGVTAAPTSANVLAMHEETSTSAPRSVSGSAVSGTLSSQSASRSANSNIAGGGRSIAMQSEMPSALSASGQSRRVDGQTSGQMSNATTNTSTKANSVQPQINASSIALAQQEPAKREVNTQIGAGTDKSKAKSAIETRRDNTTESGYTNPAGTTNVGTAHIAANERGQQTEAHQPAQGVNNTPASVIQRGNAVAMHQRNAVAPIVPGGRNTMLVGASGNTAATAQESSIALNNQRLPALVPQREVKLVLPKEPEPDPVAQMFARLARREQELRGDDGKKKKDKKEDDTTEGEKLWTSAGFAAGSFTNKNSGVTATGSNMGIASNSGVAAQQLNASGASYSVGVGLGKRVTERWVVQGGVNYQTQLYNYSADRAVGDFQNQTLQAVSINTLERADAFDARSQARVVSTAPYTINNDSRFVSVPVQAGYLLVKKRTGVQLNAGVSTDLFLQNTNGASGDISNTTERLGDNSTYRSINFSGLMGTEVSYKFGQRYRLALTPGMRYAFSSIFKSSTGVQAMPLTFDVGLRFRYIFH